MISIPVLSYPHEYFFGLALVIAAVVNYVLAAMLLFDANNYLFDETPRYKRSRRLTGLSLAVFATGFVLHWLFMPHFHNPLLARALSFSYFHLGGVLLSMSHTGLIDRHYFTRGVAVRDISICLFSIVVYWTSVLWDSTTLTHASAVLFFMHIGYLTWLFYSRFYRIYIQLGRYADYLPNDTDSEVKWLLKSCHLIILFGIGGIAFTIVFHDTTMPFTILLLVGILVFTYIYKSLANFGFVALEAEGNLQKSEEFVTAETHDEPAEHETTTDDGMTPEADDNADEAEKCVEQWVAGKYFTDPRLTVNDALEQMNLSANALNFYLERHTSVGGYRKWLACLRIEEAKRIMLEHPNYSLQTVAEECGYANNSSLSRAFKAQEGLTPMEWLEQHIPQ